ncbi:MAG TPA: APC family permease [Opitutaceae bacterium]|jgi:amino acid transporter
MSLKSLLFGREKSLSDRNLFHSLSLIAVFAWVGLGADGLSSSCYGPEETYKALGGATHLSLFVALGCVVTIVAICASYSQIISLFPTGGGGYLVASKLLSPGAGVVSGCALLIDYVLTVTISVASGADALFSLFPAAVEQFPVMGFTAKLFFEMACVVGLTLINMRGVKESVLIWVPIFAVFVLTHAFAIIYALASHGHGLAAIPAATAHDIRSVSASVGTFGLMALLLRSYSMGAGTYTGIEAVSNGLPILREPRVKTGRRTMVYMGISLAVTVAGLLLAYQLYNVEISPDKTLNAVLFERMTTGWGHGSAAGFIFVTLLSEAALLIIAAQTGFLDGPRVLANMALDRWFPAQFANLSERLVTRNGVLLMGLAGFAMMWATHGSVDLLVIFYSINVFITFSLSQAGMVRHWWQERGSGPGWLHKLLINGFGLILTASILVSLTAVKFFEGGWATLAITALLVLAAYAVKRHYNGVRAQLGRLDAILDAAEAEAKRVPASPAPADPKARTAVILVNGFNGLGLHTILNVPRIFGNTFRNLVFVQVGSVDAGNFKGAAEIDQLRAHTEGEAARYVQFAQARGFGSKSFTSVGYDITGEVMKLAREASTEFPNQIFFAGQLLFTNETNLTRWLHNHTVATLQRRFFLSNMPFVVLPIRVGA